MTMLALTLQPLVPWWLLAAASAVLLFATIQPLVRASSRAEKVSWVRRTVAVAVLALIGTGPSLATETLDNSAAAVDVFFVVDRTGSMAAEDWGADGTQPRLEGVRGDIVALTEAIPGGRYSIISFDSQATRQLPLTWDPNAVLSWTETFHQEITRFSEGSLTDRPLDELAAALEGSAEEEPAHMRVVFFMSDGEQTAEGEPRSFAELAELVDDGAVLGYGTAEGGRMRTYEPGETNTTYIQDPAGGDAISRIDEEILRDLADELGVEYRHRQESVATLARDLDPDEVTADGRRAVTTHRIVVWPLALLLAGLLAWEAWVFAARAQRSWGAPPTPDQQGGQR